MDPVDEALKWGLLLMLWLLLLVTGGTVVHILRRPFWLRRLRRLERGRKEQGNA